MVWWQTSTYLSGLLEGTVLQVDESERFKATLELDVPAVGCQVNMKLVKLFHIFSLCQ